MRINAKQAAGIIGTSPARREFFDTGRQRPGGDRAGQPALAEDGLRRERRSAGSEAAPRDSARQERHLVFHGRRPQPCRPVRSQAGAGEICRSADAAVVSSGDTWRDRIRHQQERHASLAAHVQAIRPERPVGFRLAAAHRRARRRYSPSSGRASPTPSITSAASAR